jgi:predicted  nucleic acid-binding Zn-ribbon protein
VQGLTERLSAGQAVLIGANSEIAALTEASVRLLELIEAGSQHGREKIPAALAEAEVKLVAIEQRLANLQKAAGEVVGFGAQLQEHVTNANESMSSASLELGALHSSISERTAGQSATLEQLRKTLEQIETQTGDLATRAQTELTSAIQHLALNASQAVAGIEGENSAAISRIANRIGDEAKASIDRVLDERATEVAGQLEAAVAKAADVSRTATIHLRDQLTKVDELAGNLERRVAQARERAEEQVDNDFARRVALITEALNSNAIDIATTLDTEISDSAWNSYLKGDRSIFTRRAVNLIQGSEAKAIIQIYQNDDNFRGHANRFIHDFEAMLRQILSTRDGNALGVTLLSSDMGKLYVGLAQAIERLRN